MINLFRVDFYHRRQLFFVGGEGVGGARAFGTRSPTKNFLPSAGLGLGRRKLSASLLF